MDFKSYLKSSAGEVEKELKIFLSKWSREVESVSPKLVELNKAFIQANEGGKRIRGVLVKLGYELAGGKNIEEILKPAAAFEIFQTSILSHDDIVDLSPLRRGKQTLYKALGGDHYGISQALSLGDVGYFLAINLISESRFPEKEKNLALSVFTEAMLKTGLGQILDIELPHLKELKKEVDVLAVFRLKTAHYTLIGPLKLGAVLGGADEKILDEIAQFGEALGIAFQIQDDILGVFGDEETLGKSVTSDIEEGKNTLLIVQALKKASPEQNKILEKYYGQGKIGTKGLAQIKKVFLETGALEYSKKRAGKLVEEAKKIIEKMKISGEYKNLLSEMADFLVKRDK